MDNPQQTSGAASYLGALRRRRRLLLLVAVPIILGAAALALSLPDRYQSSGVISIEQQRMEGVKKSTTTASDEYVQESVRSITTALFTEKGLAPAAQALHPYPDLGDDISAAAARMVSDVKLDMIRTTILDPMSGREREIISGIRITYLNSDPKMAFRGADWLTKAFLEADRQKRAGREAETETFFAKEADRVSEQMDGLEQKMANHRRQNMGKLPELAAANMNSIDRDQRDLDNAQLQISMLRKDRVFIQQRLAESNSTYGNSEQLARAEEELRKKSAIYDPSHPDIVSLRRQIESLRLAGTSNASGGGGASLKDQLDALKATLAETRQRYSDDHPDVRRINRQIDTLQQRIASGEKVAGGATVRTAASEQLEVQLRSTDTQIAGLESRASELRGKIGTTETRMAATPEVERETEMLNRDINQARAKYEQLLASKMDAEVTRSAISEGKADEFRVMQQPIQPTSPAKPQRAAIGVFGLILGLVLSVTTVGVAELIDPAVRNTRDLQMLISVVPLAVVPTIRTAASVARNRRVLQLALTAAVACAAMLFVGVRLWVK
jgi:polysaccharide biosynthesis transport protein